MAREIGKPIEQQVRLVAQVCAQRAAGLGLEAFQPVLNFARRLRRHSPDRGEKALREPLINPVLGQHACGDGFAACSTKKAVYGTDTRGARFIAVEDRQ
jgi:hypothetical protein